MDIGSVSLNVTLPGRAGALQAAGASASLIAELGGNYDTYHAFLASQLSDLSVPPDPDDYPDITTYLAAWDKISAIIRAEAILRWCRVFVTAGVPIGTPDRSGVPLINGDHQLVSVTAASGAGASSSPVAP
jgi:hypothetical protein